MINNEFEMIHIQEMGEKCSAIDANDLAKNP